MQRQPLMRVRVEERDPVRLRALARDWNVPVVAGQHEAVIAAAIANAYRRMVEKEKRNDALHDREG